MQLYVRSAPPAPTSKLASGGKIGCISFGSYRCWVGTMVTVVASKKTLPVQHVREYLDTVDP